MSEFAKSIARIGLELVRCDSDCQGVSCEQAEGILPRGLILEDHGRKGDGCAVIGINPHISTREERDFYRREGATYDAILKWWTEKASHHKYYNAARNLLDELRLTGPILWTEVVKCEKSTPERTIPSQTRKECIRRFLNRELEALPPSWPLITFGKMPFKSVVDRFVSRTIVGFPHSSNGWLPRLMDHSGKLLSCVETEARRALEVPGSRRQFIVRRNGELDCV